MTFVQPAAARVADSSAGPRRVTLTQATARRWHALALVAADAAATALAFFVAYHLRYTYQLGGDIPGENFVDYQFYLPVQVLFIGLCLLGQHLRSAYVVPRPSPFVAETMALLGTTAVAAMMVFAIVSMVHYTAVSRLAFIFAWLLAFLFGIVARGAVRAVRAELHRHGYGIERTIVVGSNRLARMMMQQMAHDPHSGCKVLGFVDEPAPSPFGRFPALGAIDQLPTLIKQMGADRVIIALPATQHEEILRILDHCGADGVRVSLVPDLFELRLSYVTLETVGGIPLLDLLASPIGGWNLIVKRGLDMALSLALLIVLSPLFALIALAIHLESPGPVFFRQVRLGKGGTPFECTKFRSMRDGAETEQARLETLNETQGPIFKMRDDPRLTRVGRALRRTSMDELPQLWNALRGDMSLVGPRPPLPSEVERYEDWHRHRLEVTPGITGLWQVSGRSELPFDEMVMLDLYYIENWSLGLDFQILVRTIPTVLATRGAF